MKIVMTTLEDELGRAERCAEQAIENAGVDVSPIISVNEEGEGYVRGTNKALAQVEDGEYFCLLNNDSYPETDNWLAILLDEMKKREEALNVWFAGPSGGCRTAPQNHGRLGDNRRPKLVRHLAGFCMLCHPDMLAKVGMLDDRYIHYAGEIDWQWRATRDYDAQALWVPEVYVSHQVHPPHQEWWARDHKVMNEVWK